MATAAPGVPVQQLTLEEKIQIAITKAGEVTALFVPAAGAAIAAGAEVEPIIAGMVHLFLGIFQHHAKQQVASH